MDKPVDDPYNFRCWDCGSSISGHHTPLCALSGPNDVKDLPARPGTQWWTGEEPSKD